MLLLEARGIASAGYGNMLEGRGYQVLRAADSGEAASLMKRRTDIALVIVGGHESIDNDIVAVRDIRASAVNAPWVEYIVLCADMSAAPQIPISDREAEWIVLAHDHDSALSAIADAYNMARLQRYQLRELSDLEHALQEFRTRTESAMSQLLSRTRGRFLSADAAVRGEDPAWPACGSEVMARAMEEERARARVRERLFGSFRLGHAGWMLMLVLAENQTYTNELTVKSAAYAAGIPLSSALRKIVELCENGLLLRRNDPSDNRRSFVALTERARTLLSEYLAAGRSDVKA